MKIIGYRIYNYTAICPRCNAVITFSSPEIKRGGFLFINKGIHCPKCNKFISKDGAHRERDAMLPQDYEEKYENIRL